jgi:hypothetical protein
MTVPADIRLFALGASRPYGERIAQRLGLLCTTTTSKA